MQQAHETFTCNACGHQFTGARAQLEQQPTCPKCRTFGQIVGEDGKSISARRNVVKMQHPGPGGNAPYAAARGGPVGYEDHDEDGYVEVAAEVTYGQRTNTKNIINIVIMLALGIGIIITLFFIVTTLQEDRSEQIRQEREIVLDKAAFEEAIDTSVGNAKTALQRVEGAQVQESTNFDEAIQAIITAGGSSPNWEAPPRPGNPFRVQGFTVTHEYKGAQVKGFVMLLYYETAEEVGQAQFQLNKYFDKEMTHYGIKVNSSMWYVAYMGVSHGGPMRDALKTAMDVGAPSTFKQFTDRVGGTLRDELKD
jgi:hypothetical protein